jgi:Zn-dependent protease with chaperone function
MYIINPLTGAGASSLFSTHPPVGERVRRLRAYNRTMRPKVAALRPDRQGRRAA